MTLAGPPEAEPLLRVHELSTEFRGEGAPVRGIGQVAGNRNGRGQWRDRVVQPIGVTPVRHQSPTPRGQHPYECDPKTL